MNKIFLMFLIFISLLNARESLFWVGPGQVLDVPAGGTDYPFRDINGYGTLQPLAGGSAVAITWYRAGSTQKNSIRLPWQRDVGLPLCRVLPSGELAVADMGGRLRIMNGDGAVIREVGLYPQDGAYSYNSENIILMENARNGHILTAVWLAREKRVLLTLFGPSLAPLYRNEYRDVYLRQIGLDPAGKSLGLALYTAHPFVFDTRVMDEGGRLLIRSAQRTRAFVFDDQGHVALRDKKRLEVYDLTAKKQTGVYETEQLISAAVFDDAGRLIVETARVSRRQQSASPFWYYGNIRLHWLDEAAHLQKMENIAGGSYYPSLIYDHRESRLWVGLEEKQAVREVRR